MEGCSLTLLNRIKLELKLDCSRNCAHIFYKAICFDSLQRGTTCGFYALAACGKYFQISAATNVEKLIDFAKWRNFTNNGELFSVEWMAEIAREHWKSENRVDISIGDIPTHSELIHLTMQMNALILVPYDCDKDFTPCERNGHAAHWAIVTGFLITNTEWIIAPDDSKDSSTDNTAGFVTWCNPELEAIYQKTANDHNFYTIAYQSKSKYPAMWNYEKLRRSNAQLSEPNPKYANEFRLPLQSIDKLQGLCGKCLIIATI